MKKVEITIKNPGVAVVLTKEQAESLGIDTTADKHLLEITTAGPWNTLRKCRGICIVKEFKKDSYGRTETSSITFYGKRSLSKIAQGGYELNGYVCVGGKAYSAYSSSVMIEVNGKLIDVQVLCARVNKVPNNP